MLLTKYYHTVHSARNYLALKTFAYFYKILRQSSQFGQLRFNMNLISLIWIKVAGFKF